MDFSSDGSPALAVWTKQELVALWTHLHNDNGPVEWVMGYVDRDTGAVNFCRSKKVSVTRGIPWAIGSLADNKPADKKLAFAPYSSNGRDESRWGGMDFDAHDGDTARAERLARAAVDQLRLMNFAVILESSGSGGWHVWAITKEFRPVSGWIRILKMVAAQIEVEIRSGLCEIFPQDRLNLGLGKGLRAPGAWNPKTNRDSLIHWHNADELIAQFSALPASPRKSPIGELASSASETSPIEKKVYLSLPLSLEQGMRILGLESGFAIMEPSTRHQKLASLVGAVFFLCSREYARHLAKLQYAEKKVSTAASEREHLDDFESLWNGMEIRRMKNIPALVRAKHDILTTAAERDALRIIENFARKAASDGVPDFPIARDNLASRLCMTGRGAGELRRRFVRLGILEQTAAYRPNVKAARYRWLCDATPITGSPLAHPRAAAFNGDKALVLRENQ